MRRRLGACEVSILRLITAHYSVLLHLLLRCGRLTETIRIMCNEMNGGRNLTRKVRSYVTGLGTDFPAANVVIEVVVVLFTVI